MPNTGRQIYGDGTNSTVGPQTMLKYYERLALESANAVNVFQQFADRNQMPQRTGKTFAISKFLNMYDRMNDTEEFRKKGYLSSRTVDEVTTSLANASLAEGAGAVNKRQLKKITMETTLTRVGEMIDYTDEVELFSEDVMSSRYYKAIGDLANSRLEDLIMMDMLATPTVIYAGPAASMRDIGVGIADDGSTDAMYVTSWDLIRSVVRKAVQNRAVKNTKMVTGSNKIDTKTVNSAYYGIIGPEIKSTLETVVRKIGNQDEAAFVPAYKYAAAGNLAEGEIGQVHEMRFIETERLATYGGRGASVAASYEGSLSYSGESLTLRNVSGGAVDITGKVAGDPYGTTIADGDVLEVDTLEDAEALEDVLTRDLGYIDVFPIVIPTQDSFATIGLKGVDKLKIRRGSPDKDSNENPYGTRGFYSYNFFYAGIILQEERLLKVLAAAYR